MLVELTEFLVKSIVKNPDMVSVKKLGEEEETITIQVLVENSDMGAVIGKNGNIAKAIRTIVQASSYKNNEPRVKIEIDSF
ncbi:MAG: KH domain-containing protein [Bacilli bacterium]|nr:KH domain-containing protein [Bacilli bacterium]MCI9585918.1 KH domain-containing protein [Bacilli bacterium]